MFFGWFGARERKMLKQYLDDTWTMLRRCLYAQTIFLTGFAGFVLCAVPERLSH